MSGNLANLALDGGDARLSHDAAVRTAAGGEKHIDMLARPGPYGTGIKTHDPNVTFEEYLYFARVTRSNVEHEDPSGNYTLFGKTLKKSRNGHSHFGGSNLPESYRNIGIHNSAGGDAGLQPPNEKETAYGAAPGSGSDSEQAGRAVITEAEWVQASRALRTASWGAVFFLITTDILGPFSTAWAFAAMGYGPGVTLFTVFGVLAAYAGFLLWKMFLGLDSDRYPLRSYGDIAFRVYGSVARHTVNILQSIQLFFNVAIILVVNALSTEEVIAGPDGNRSWCFIAIVVLWAVVGAVFAQIRTLKNLAWIANLAIWLNVFVMISNMALAATQGHDYSAAYAANGPLFGFAYLNSTVTTTAGEVPSADFSLTVNGLGQAVFSYGGAMLFVEFMAEMRRPFDFWKGMLFAQMFIYFFYMLYGLVIYSYQGQFSMNPSYQGIEPYAWQTVGNIIELVTSVIAALLYGNIGVKVIYNNVLIDLFRFPDLSTRGGKLIWVAFVPIYWAIAFVIGSAIPQVSTLQAFIASLCILQFSYTFPPWLMIGFLSQRDALQEGEGFNPATGQTIRHDSGLRRWARGFKRQILFNTWNTIFMLGALCTAALGLYAAIEGMITTYGAHPGSSFTCNNPYDY